MIDSSHAVAQLNDLSHFADGQEHQFTLYGYVPNLPANLIGLVFFSLLFIFQVGAGIYYRQWWFGVTWSIGQATQVMGYAFRVHSHYAMPYVADMFQGQLVVLTISPVFLVAGIYYLLAKIIVIHHEKVSYLSPMLYSAIFIVADLISLVVQAAGGGYAAVSMHSMSSISTDILTDDDLEGSINRARQMFPDFDHYYSRARVGGWVMEAGIIFQLVMMTIFVVLTFIIAWKIYREKDDSKFDPKYAHLRKKRRTKLLLPAYIASLLFIYIRCGYRVAELAKGWLSPLLRTERYHLALDGLMILFACLCLSIVYPGFALGRDPIPVRGLHSKKFFRDELDAAPSIESNGESKADVCLEPQQQHMQTAQDQRSSDPDLNESVPKTEASSILEEPSLPKKEV